MMRLSEKLKIVCIIFISLLAAGFLFLRFSPYPDFSKFKNQSYSARIYDCAGNLIQILPVENGLRREWTPVDEIPDNVKKIFIQAEDKRFYFHSGVDYLALANAFLQNLKAKKTVRGASTITMQLVKIISGEEGSRNLAQKISDIFNAHRLEARLSKKQILEFYLNSVPFGMNSEGITSAARSFYGKELSSLSADEIKCLSVIPRRPSSFNPAKNPENCAKEAGVPVEAAKNAFFYEYPFFMPHYVNQLKSEFNKRNQKLLYKIQVSADLNLQLFAEKLLQNAVAQAAQSRISNGAVLVIKNDDASVLAWAGSNSWFDEIHGGQIDGVLVKNQPGSSMKPFLYALALDTSDENGNPLYYPSKILADVPKEFGSANLYIPMNFNNRFNGPVRLRVALASSLNVPAVSVLNDLGVEKYLENLFELGFDSLRSGGKEAALGLALGAGEVRLGELVPAFSVFARDGKFIPLNLTGNNGSKICEKQIYSTDTARIIASILSDKSSRALGFGYSQTFQTSYPSIFKTGTANQYQNIVALGATKKYTVGVWMGNFSGETVVGRTGSSLPAFVAKSILDFLEKKSDSYDKEFPEPENWIKTKICPLSGMPAGENCPSSVYDYVKKGIQQEKCTWHKKDGNSVYVEYPSEYQTWILENKIAAEIDYNSSSLEIQTPQDGAVFYFSGQNSENQSVQVEVTGGSEDVLSVEYDGNFLCELSRPFRFFLPLERGNHKITALCGDEKKEICFVVK